MKFIIKSFVFVVVLLAPVLWVAKYDNLILDRENTNFARILAVKDHLSLDYLIVGNSYGYSSVYPPLFDSLNLSVYNYGIPGAGPLFYELLVNDYLNCNKGEVDHVILVISPTIFSEGSDDWGAFPYHRYLSCPISSEFMLTNDTDFDKYLKVKQSSFVRGLHWLRTRTKTETDQLADQSEDYKGFYHRYDTFSTRYYQENKSLYEHYLNDELQQDKKKRFFELLDLMKSNNVNPIIIETPRNRLEDFFTSDYMEDYQGVLMEIEESNLTLIRNEWNPDSTYFRDIDHLNFWGAQEYTQRLIDHLNLSENAL